MAVRTCGRRRAEGSRWLLFLVEMVALALIAQQLWGQAPGGDPFPLPMSPGSTSRSAAVTFDCVPAVMARPINDPSLRVAPGYEAVEVRLQVSTLMDPAMGSEVSQLLYRFLSHDGNAQVLDYSPRTELVSSADGPVEVVLTDESTEHIGLNVNSFNPMVKADAGTEAAQKRSQSTKYKRQARQESAIASGTVSQGRGVYFKLRAAHDRTLEGDKTFSVILMLPQSWQATMLEVAFQAWGNETNARRPLASDNMTIALWREGSAEGQRTALRFAHAVEGLRGVARQYDSAIRDRSMPTVFHRLGAALEVMPRKIPENWLEQVMFCSVDAYHDEGISHLPVDVRVAILEYQDARQNLLEKY